MAQAMSTWISGCTGSRHTLLPLLLLLLTPLSATAQSTDEQPADNREAGFEIRPYEVQYKARYRGLRASAVSNLQVLGNQHYQMHNRVELKLLGKTVVSITENSHFSIDERRFISGEYEFVQDGIGDRVRRQNFNHAEGQASVMHDEKLSTVAIEGEVLDELNAFLYLRRAVAEASAKDIFFMQLDKDQVEEMHYQVLGQELIDTPLGEIDALVLERVRAPDSRRSTKIWLAPQWDYLMIQLEQVDPKDRKMTLEVEEITLEGVRLGQ